MKNLLAGIVTKFSGSAVSTDVAGRIYEGQAPEGAQFPYIVFSIVVGNNEDTFQEKITEYPVQFSLYSISRGLTEVGTMYADLRTLFDDATFSITGNTLVRCQFQNFLPIVDEITSKEGTKILRHWAVDYLLTVRAN